MIVGRIGPLMQPNEAFISRGIRYVSALRIRARIKVRQSRLQRKSFTRAVMRDS